MLALLWAALLVLFADISATFQIRQFSTENLGDCWAELFYRPSAVDQQFQNCRVMHVVYEHKQEKLISLL